jgi:uncharacterized protein involved in response to NO
MNVTPRIGWNDVACEPFRIFFPAAVITGIFAVALWPLHFSGIIAYYPGTTHAQLMAHGFFGGFIFGVLGTGLPRMLSVKPFRLAEVLLLFSIYTTLILLNFSGRVTYAAMAAIVLVFAFFTCMAPRIVKRKDVPPPGFVLVGLALLCLVSGASISIFETYADEIPPFWLAMQRLLSYQGFVLLPILGVSGFLLPRFFDLPNTHNFEESRTPPPGWSTKAGLALAAGLAVLLSFIIEASGRERVGHLLRFAVSAAYLFTQVPFYRSAIHKNTIRVCLALAIVLMLLGFLAVAIYPVNKVAVLHVTLAGGFAVLTFGVATRVVFGHSGNQSLLARPNRWLLVAVGLMLLGMATRISGDFFPRVRVSHYGYGALAWIIGSIIWAAYVLPKILTPDPDRS